MDSVRPDKIGHASIVARLGALLVTGCVLAACAMSQDTRDPDYDRLSLYRDAPWELTNPDFKRLLTKAETHDLGDWQQVLRAAMTHKMIIPDDHLTRYEATIAERLAGTGSATTEDVNRYLEYVATVSVERRDERLLALYRTAFPPQTYARVDLSRAVYLDALPRLKGAVKFQPADQETLVSAVVNYLHMYADNIDQWQTTYDYGTAERGQVVWLKDMVLRTRNAPESARVKTLIRKLEPEMYCSVYGDCG